MIMIIFVLICRININFRSGFCFALHCIALLCFASLCFALLCFLTLIDLLSFLPCTSLQHDPIFLTSFFPSFPYPTLLHSTPLYSFAVFTTTLQIEYSVLRASSEKPRDLSTFLFSSTSFPSKSDHV